LRPPRGLFPFPFPFPDGTLETPVAGLGLLPTRPRLRARGLVGNGYGSGNGNDRIGVVAQTRGAGSARGRLQRLVEHAQDLPEALGQLFAL
jgi:hypothetical protein